VIASAAEVGSAFAAVAELVTPAVVSIQVQALRPVNNRFAPPGSRALARGSGSGFIVSRDGYILTNNHVVADAQKVTVGLSDRRVLEARVIGRDPTTDVAVIKIEGTDFPTLALGDDEAVRVGEWVLAVGNPLGLDFTVTSGIVSAKGRAMPGLLDSRYSIGDFIQTDAAINPGNSGGPLVDIRGRVIGINSAIASPTGYNAGYGFAIPVTLAQSVMRDLIAYGEVRRGLLGLELRDVDAPTAARLGLKTIAGALVTSYDGDSPSRAAGVRVDDVIVRVDGRPVERLGTLQRVVRMRKPGDVVALGVVRGGTELTLRVKLASAPAVVERVASND
jgi:serine protease Do